MSRRRPWILLAALTLARAAYGAQFQSVGAVGPAMVQGLGLAYASLGTLVGAYTTLGIPLALPVGWLTARLGDRWTVVGGLGLMIAGALVIAAAPGLEVALAGRIVSGAGGVLLIVALPTIVMSQFAGRSLPIAIGTLLTGYSVGIAGASAALPALGSWRLAMIAIAGLCALSMLATAPLLEHGTGHAAERRPDLRLGPRELKPVLAAGTAWGFVNAGFAALLGFAAVFFVGRGWSAQDAGSLVSLTALATVPLGPIGGWLCGRRPVTGIAVGTVLNAVTVALLPLGVAPAALLVVSGLALGAIAGPMVALPAAVLAPEHRAMGMSVFWLMFFVLMTALPPLAGLARDLTSVTAAPLYAAAVFNALALPALAAYAGTRRLALAGVAGE